MTALVKLLNGAAKGRVVVMGYHQAIKQQKIGMVKIIKLYQDEVVKK